MPKKKALILGASRYYSKSIEATRKAGYFTIAVDRNPDSPGFESADTSEVCDIVDRESVLKLAKRYEIDGIIPVNDYGVPTAAFVASELRLPGISKLTAELSTNKERMREAWARAGVSCPRFEVATSEKKIREAIGNIRLPCILKPAHGIGGASRGVVVIRDKSEISDAIRFSHSYYEDKTTLVETYVESEREHSAEVLIADGTIHVIAIADKIKTPLPYRVDKNVLYPTALPKNRKALVTQRIKEAIHALGIDTGAVHIEFATTADGDCVFFELGARCGGGGTPEPIVHYVTGINEFVEMVRILCNDSPEQLVPLYNRGCNYHFLIFDPGKIASISGFRKIKDMDGVLDSELFVKKGDVIREVSDGTQRSGFIIIGADTREKALENGKKAERMIEVKYFN